MVNVALLQNLLRLFARAQLHLLMHELFYTDTTLQTAKTIRKYSTGNNSTQESSRMTNGTNGLSLEENKLF